MLTVGWTLKFVYQSVDNRIELYEKTVGALSLYITPKKLAQNSAFFYSLFP